MFSFTHRVRRDADSDDDDEEDITPHLAGADVEMASGSMHPLHRNHTAAASTLTAAASAASSATPVRAMDEIHMPFSEDSPNQRRISSSISHAPSARLAQPNQHHQHQHSGMSESARRYISASPSPTPPAATAAPSSSSAAAPSLSTAAPMSPLAAARSHMRISVPPRSMTLHATLNRSPKTSPLYLPSSGSTSNLHANVAVPAADKFAATARDATLSATAVSASSTLGIGSLAAQVAASLAAARHGTHTPSRTPFSAALPINYSPSPSAPQTTANTVRVHRGVENDSPTTPGGASSAASLAAAIAAATSSAGNIAASSLSSPPSPLVTFATSSTPSLSRVPSLPSPMSASRPPVVAPNPIHASSTLSATMASAAIPVVAPNGSGRATPARPRGTTPVPTPTSAAAIAASSAFATAVSSTPSRALTPVPPASSTSSHANQMQVFIPSSSNSSSPAASAAPSAAPSPTPSPMAKNGGGSVFRAKSVTMRSSAALPIVSPDPNTPTPATGTATRLSPYPTFHTRGSTPSAVSAAAAAVVAASTFASSARTRSVTPATAAHTAYIPGSAPIPVVGGVDPHRASTPSPPRLHVHASSTRVAISSPPSPSSATAMAAVTRTGRPSAFPRSSSVHSVDMRRSNSGQPQLTLANVDQDDDDLSDGIIPDLPGHGGESSSSNSSSSSSSSDSSDDSSSSDSSDDDDNDANDDVRRVPTSAQLAPSTDVGVADMVSPVLPFNDDPAHDGHTQPPATTATTSTDPTAVAHSSPSADATSQPQPNAAGADVATSTGTVAAGLDGIRAAPKLSRAITAFKGGLHANKAKERAGATSELTGPDEDKAERFRNLTCPRKRDPTTGTYALYDVWKFTDRQFLQYGLGVMLWFKLVRRLSYLFLILFLLNLPSLMINVNGPDPESVAWKAEAELAANVTLTVQPRDSTFGLTKTTMANLGEIHNATYFGFTKQDVGLGIGAIDCFSCILFLIACYFIFRDHASDATKYNANVMTVRRFTVLVTNVPDGEEIAEYYEAIQRGDNPIILSTSDEGRRLLKEAKKRRKQNGGGGRQRQIVPFNPIEERERERASSTSSEFNPAHARLALAHFFQTKFGPVVDVSCVYDNMSLIQLFKRRGELKRELQTAEMRGAKTKKAELIKKIASLDRTILHSRRKNHTKLRAAFVTFQYQESVSRALLAYPESEWARCLMHKDLRFGRRPPHVVRAAEPSNTIFPNLGLSRLDQCCRRAWTGLVSLLLMSGSFAAVFVSQYYQSRIPSSLDCEGYPRRTLDEAREASAFDERAQFCYCASLSAGDLYSETGFCGDYLKQFGISQGLLFLTATCTVLVNALLQLFMDRLAALERHNSVTSHQRGVTSRLFWGLFFNTGVIIVLVNADFSPYLLDMGFANVLLTIGKYSDFEASWYREVGVSILLTMFLNTMNPHLLSMLAIPWDAMRRKRCKRWAKTQAKLNELYQGRRFVLFERYSVLLNTAFVCMMFAPGMPLLWFVGAVTFTLTYWFDKYTFLRSYRIPPRYDESLDMYASAVLPYAVLPHLILALWFYSAPMTYGYSMNLSLGGLNDSVLRRAFNRILQWNTFPLFLLLGSLVAMWIVKRVLAMIFFCRASEAEKRNLRMGHAEKFSRSRQITYTEACAKVGLESYRLSRQNDFRTAYIATPSGKQMAPDIDLHLLAGSAAIQNQFIGASATMAMHKHQTHSKHPLPPYPPHLHTHSNPNKSGAGGGSAGGSPLAPGAYASTEVVSLRPSPRVFSNKQPRPNGSDSSNNVNHAIPPVPLPLPLPAGAASKYAAHPSFQRGQHSHHHQHQQQQPGANSSSSNLSPSPPTLAWAAPSETKLDKDGMSVTALSVRTTTSGGGGGVSAPQTPAHANAAAIAAATAAERPSMHHRAASLSTEQQNAPVATINNAPPDVVLRVAAAAAAAAAADGEGNESTPQTLLPITCPTCSQVFNIVDTGVPQSYTCPFCSAQTVI